MSGVRPRVLPWEDIEEIGVLKMYEQKFTTVRLRSYKALLEGMSQQEAQFATRFLPALRVMGYAAVTANLANLEGERNSATP
jgi:hypothetical protein